MTPLDRLIRDDIVANGPMGLAPFMDLALQHPQHGYYRTRDPLGARGDFITAPEVSQMFGEMIGLWAADLWAALGRPAAFVLLELGPGRGTLMQDALRATRKVPGFHQALRLYFMESSAVLRAEQMERLHDFKPAYCETLDELPPVPLIVVANEFFDALPIRQFVRAEDGAWHERSVDVEGNRLVFTAAPPAAPFAPPPEGVARFWEVSEIALLIVHELATLIAQRGGGALILDYGYAAPPEADTLQAVARHASADPLLNVGEADLTAHVNFGALARVAERAGLRAHGPVGQGAFLEAMGIYLRAALLKNNASAPQAEAIDHALHRLMDAAEMGTLFKALALTPPALIESAGFQK
jgi:NADH dehydrogenase [ubiquinone] 1 alpha subcomplex assembly factor 7